MLFADSVCPAASDVLPTQWFLSCESDNTPQWIYQALTEVRFSVTQNIYILMVLYNTTVVNHEIKKFWLHFLLVHVLPEHEGVQYMCMLELL